MAGCIIKQVRRVYWRGCSTLLQRAAVSKKLPSCHMSTARVPRDHKDVRVTDERKSRKKSSRKNANGDTLLLSNTKRKKKKIDEKVEDRKDNRTGSPAGLVVAWEDMNSCMQPLQENIQIVESTDANISAQKGNRDTEVAQESSLEKGMDGSPIDKDDSVRKHIEEPVKVKKKARERKRKKMSHEVTAQGTIHSETEKGGNTKVDVPTQEELIQSSNVDPKQKKTGSVTSTEKVCEEVPAIKESAGLEDPKPKKSCRRKKKSDSTVTGHGKDEASHSARSGSSEEGTTDKNTGGSAVARNLETTKNPENKDESFMSIYFPFNGKSDKHLTQMDKFAVQTKSLDGERFYHLQSRLSSHVFPSVTTILAKHEKKELIGWRINSIKRHGMSGHLKHVKHVLESGTSFHKNIEIKMLDFLAREQSIKTVQIKEPVLTTTDKVEEEGHQSESDGFMRSIEHVLVDISDIRALETSIAHFKLGYMGTFDCIARYKGKICMIDWKTSQKIKPTLDKCYDYPLQLVAYAGAVNQNFKTFGFKVQNLLIVVAYADGHPADVHFVNHKLSQDYWIQWLRRLYDYHTRSSEDLSEVYC